MKREWVEYPLEVFTNLFILEKLNARREFSIAWERKVMVETQAKRERQ